MTRNEEEAAVVLLGHGSGLFPDAATPVRALRTALLARGPWREVHVAFMKEPPFLEDVLPKISATRVYFVPVFAGRGHYTQIVIPDALKSVEKKLGQERIYTLPVGEHPNIAAHLADQAEVVLQQKGLAPRAVEALLIAHGSSRPGGSQETPQRIASAMVAMNRFAGVRLLFLQQNPSAWGWREQVQHQEVVVLPLLVARGLHMQRDIPLLFEDTAPYRVHLTPGLGADEAMVDMVAEMMTTARYHVVL